MSLVYLSRFDTNTVMENREFRTNHSHIGCIYGNPYFIKCRYSLPIFVVEMNNTDNRIEGIGLILNIPKSGPQYNLYTTRQYNQKVYCGKYRIDRTDLLTEDIELLQFFDNVLFKGKGNLKRGSGITHISERIFERESVNITYRELKERIRKIFNEKFEINILENNINNV
jgi:hypothetical protein